MLRVIASLAIIALAATCLAATTTLTRITVIGASVSDGFGLRLRTTLPDGSRPVTGVNVAQVLQAAARDPSLVITTHASSMYFSDPVRYARRSVERTLADKPALVLAIDWMFWNAYGSSGVGGKRINGCEDRMALLETGLNALEPLAATGVPIVLGDIPDMQSAIGGGMITENMVPDEACLARLNVRLKSWTDTHPNIMLLPLNDVVQKTLAKKPIRACNRDWCETDLGPMLQKDRLHPTLNGTLAVVAAALDAADRGTAGAASKSFNLDPAAVRSRMNELAAARAKAAPPTSPSGDPAAQPSAGDSASPRSP